jgi:uroporphyrinogen decarboxylase
MSFVDDLVKIGVDALNPLEIKAGMDPILLKKKYGNKLVLHGGLNAVLWDKIDEVTQAILHNVPILKENGGYIFSSDHSIPNSVSLENFKTIVETVKQAGRY